MTKQLYALRELIEHPEKIESAVVGQLVTQEFTCERLRPMDLREVFHDQSMVVRRAATPAPAGRSAAEHQGTSGFVKALQDMVSGLGEAGQIRAALPLFDDDILWVVPGSHVCRSSDEEDEQMCHDLHAPLRSGIQILLHGRQATGSGYPRRGPNADHPSR